MARREGKAGGWDWRPAHHFAKPRGKTARSKGAAGIFFTQSAHFPLEAEPAAPNRGRAMLISTRRNRWTFATWHSVAGLGRGKTTG